MKVGFVGSGGTGKSTVLELFEDKSPFSVLHSRNRELWKKKGWKEVSQLQRDPEDVLEFQKELFLAKLEQDNGIRDRLEEGEVIICERTLLCHYVHILYRCADVISDNMVRSYEALALENVSGLDLLVHFPLTDYEDRSDGLRQMNFAYRRSIDFLYKGVLGACVPRQVLNLPVKGTSEERFGLINKAILNLLPA